MHEVLLNDKLQKLLKANWSSILDKNKLMFRVIKDVKDTEYPKVASLVKRKMEFSVTKFDITKDSEFEIWVEFTISKDKRTVIGTNIYRLKLNGELNLLESFGTEFLTEN